MGCDIHIHQEVKIDGRWEHYRETTIPRDYQVFAKMAGVRGDERPIAKPRGLPEDMAFLTRFCANHDGEDAHTHSWLDAAEIAELYKWFCIRRLRENVCHIESDGWGYLFGGLFSGFIRYPDERPEGLEDVRFVFWFDN